MGRYVTPTGVEIEMGDEAARSIGYKPVDTKPASEKKAPAKKAASRKTKSD